MNLEFITYQLEEDNEVYKKLVKDINKPNDFVIVGEKKFGELDCYLVHQLDEKGICMIPGLKITEFALPIEKKHLKVKDGIGYEINEFNVPRVYLTMDIIENIQRLNSI